MSSGHTAGEWTLETGHSVVSIMANGRRIAATSTKPYYQAHDAEDLANARVMCAAPGLLEALRSCEASLTEACRDNPAWQRPCDHAALIKARAALALALARAETPIDGEGR